MQCAMENRIARQYRCTLASLQACRGMQGIPMVGASLDRQILVWVSVVSCGGAHVAYTSVVRMPAALALAPEYKLVCFDGALQRNARR